VKVSKKFPSLLEITLIERTPTLIICSAEKCLILDENGEAYDEMDPSSEASKEADLPTVTDESGKKIAVGDQILDRNYLDYVITVKNKLQDEADLKIENNFRTPSLVSDDLRIKTAEGWNLYLNKKIEAGKEAEILKAVLSDIISKNHRADLEYIDLRIDNKIYYKFKDGTPSEIERKKAEETAAAPPAEDKKEKKKKD
jgi:cell division septal protein FtsQ